MPRISRAARTSASVGTTTGMMPFTNEFVMLELRPMIRTGFGIANKLR
jgi:hypothetical protein